MKERNQHLNSDYYKMCFHGEIRMKKENIEIQKIDKGVIIAAIIGLTLISLFAMQLGFNGFLRTAICVIIAGLAGFTLPQQKILRS